METRHGCRHRRAHALLCWPPFSGIVANSALHEFMHDVRQGLLRWRHPLAQSPSSTMELPRRSSIARPRNFLPPSTLSDGIAGTCAMILGFGRAASAAEFKTAGSMNSSMVRGPARFGRVPSASSPVTCNAFGPIAATYTGTGAPPSDLHRPSGLCADLFAAEVDRSGIEDGPQQRQVLPKACDRVVRRHSEGLSLRPM